MTIQCNALVLNADFTPVTRYPLSVWGFERTMRNVFRDRVIILEEHDVILRSANLAYRPPSVVALRDYVKRPNRVAFTRMNVFLRDNFTCQYCRQPFESHELTFDHVIPRCDGGRNSFENICAACVPCNQRKANRRDMQPYRKPREPDPHDMFRLRRMKSETFHTSWDDYLYWSGALPKGT